MKKKIDHLPNKIPVFPLSNFIIFPRTTVPLNIFEPKYIDMVDDAMKTDRIIGMIQPKKYNQNNKRKMYLKNNFLFHVYHQFCILCFELDQMVIVLVLNNILQIYQKDKI